MTATHEVTNQDTPLADYDAADDATLLDALHREGADWAEKDVRAAGILGGSAQALEWARSANRNPPELHTHDRFGHRVDEVEFHPAWHELMRTGVGLGLTGGAWRDDRPGAHVARAAKNFVWGQAESGHLCPIEMTYAAVPARAGPRRTVRAIAGLHRVPVRPGDPADQARAPGRDVDDREAGCRASCCPGCCPTAPATRCSSSA